MRMEKGGSPAFRAGLRSLCAFVIGVVAATHALGQVAVTDGGQAAYSVPLAVPPGIAGMEPKLALQYTRGSGGPFGEGWSLGGLSVITRCGSTPATDGQRKGVRYTQDDRFCLDGQRLIVTNADGVPQAQANYTGAAMVEFRTEKDSYSRVRAYGGNATSGPEYFKVWTKSGLVYEYGVDDASIKTVVQGAATQVTMAWPVSRITDTAGNYMTVSYLNGINSFAGTAGREWMVHQVLYTGKGVDQQPRNRIQFTYEDRPDKSEAFHEKAKSVTTKRLASVSTFINTTGGDREVSRYKLQYAVSPNTGRSLVQSIQQCSGGDPTKCLPATTFTYSNGPGPVFAQKPLANLNLSRKDNTKGYTRGVYQGDFNGDGRQDILVWDDDATQNHLWLSNGDGTFTGVAQPLPGAPQIGHSNGCYFASITDFNADGIADVLHIQDPTAKPTCSSAVRKSQIFLGSAGGTFQNPVALTTNTGTTLSLMRIDPTMVCTEPQGNPDWTCPGYTSYGGRNYSVVDMNGDGLPDLLFTEVPPNANDTAPRMCGAGELTCIFTGTTTVGTFTKTTTSLASENLYSPSGWQAAANLPSTYQKDRLFINDLNGDGIPDILLRDTGVLFKANGAGGAYQRIQAAPGCTTGADILDINGDGKWDVACMDYINTSPYTAHVNDGSGLFTPRSNVSNWAGVGCKDGSGADAQPATCHPMYRGFINYLAADLDGDGVSDIAAIGVQRYGGAGTPNGFLKGQRDGTFTNYAIPSLESQPLMLGSRQALVGDFTGRGTVEFLRYSDNAGDYALFVRDDSQPADLLKTVTTAGNAQTTIKYKPMTDFSVYTRGSGATYPIVDYGGAQWVVSSVDMPNGLGGVISTTYEYGAQRADLTGRGMLGFRTVKKTGPAPNGTLVSTLTTNKQNFPLNGLPEETRRYVTTSGPGTFLSLATSDYVMSCPTTATPTIHRPALASTTEETRDLGGYAVSYVQTTNAGYNCYGDPGTVTIATRRDAASTEVYTKVTANEYTHLTTGDNWILSRLVTATQTNTVPVVAFTGAVASTSSAPTVTVTLSPTPMVENQQATRTWVATNATALSVNCTGGYSDSGSKALSGSNTLTAQSAWIASPPTCLWTVSGSGVTKTVTHTLTTVAAGSSNPNPTIPAPTLTVTLKPNPLVAGQNFGVSWSSTNADTVSYTCTAQGTGFKASNTLAATGSESAMALPEWVGYPSNCVWTASGSGGTATTTVVMTTNAAPVTVPPPTIAVEMQTGMYAEQTYPITVQTTHANQVNVNCTSGGLTQTGSLPVNGTIYWAPDLSWVPYGPTTWACAFTATGAGGSATTNKTLYVQPDYTGSGS